MKKNRIKLTESHLQKVINESVKQMLSELDWRTYANAAKERALRDGSGYNSNERVRNLDRAASKALNTKFPPKDPILANSDIKTQYDDYNGHTQTGRFPSLGQSSDFRDTFVTDLDNPDDNWERTSYNGDRTKEMSDYFSGKSKYTKGKGWNVDESIRRTITNTVKKVLKESFEDDFNTARDKHMARGGMFGMELKNQEGDWEYGNVTFDPNTNTMSCMGVSIDVDPSFSVDQNLEALYDELINNGYSSD